MASLEELIKQLDTAQSYQEWSELSRKIDLIDNRVQWQMEDSSDLYDYAKLHALLKELRLARLQNNLPKLLYLVRTTFSRNFANMGNPRLFNYAQSGTKYLVNEFISECELVLQRLVEMADDTQASEVLNTLVQTRKAFGRTALVFSGGSTLGFLHFGVIRELIENNLLPRIISGSSAGSIFASVLCIHREEEFDRMVDLLSIPMSIFGPVGEEESLISHLKRVFTVGSWIDSTYLKEMMRGLIGDVTFQEAHNRTGRILNVTVSVAGSHDMPRLLNYLTTPNVVIWSAVVCSCSVPFVFAADSLFAKNPKTKELYPWSKKSFIDGSVDNDMPLARLTEMFNVNHFLACQVNPHIAPLFTKDRSSSDSASGSLAHLDSIAGSRLGKEGASNDNSVSNREGILAHRSSATGVKIRRHDSTAGQKSGWISEKITRGLETGRSLLYNEVEHGLTILKAAGITPGVATTMLNVIGQEYWGDITIVPRIHLTDLKQLFRNPTQEQIEAFVMRGRRATWPKLALIRSHCAIEVALNQAIVDLRSKVIATVFSPMTSQKYTAPMPATRKASSSATIKRSRSAPGSQVFSTARSHSTISLSSLSKHGLMRTHPRSPLNRRASVDMTNETDWRRNSTS